jgi:ferric iron reductase protein FhuF
MQHRTWCQRRTARILENKYKHHIKVYTDGSNKEDRLGYSVIWNQKNIKKRIRPQNAIFSAEQSAIYTTMKDPINKLNATDSLSTLIAAIDKKETKNTKTRKIRKLLGQEGNKITLLWALAM